MLHTGRFRGGFRRLGGAVCVVAIAVCTFVGSAFAAGNITYHNMGIFHVGDQYVGSNDDSADRWIANNMLKSCSGGDCWGRVAFVQTDGTWVFSYTDTSSQTSVFLNMGQGDFTKKPLCKDNAGFTTYNARCIGEKI